MRKQTQLWANRLAGIASLPDDTEELRLRKTTLILSAALFTIAGALWGIAYLQLGYYSGLIPLGYALFSALSLLAFFLTRRFVLFRNSQLVLVLVLPFLLQWSLGGFISSSAAMIWAFFAPLGAFFFAGSREALGWFLAYVTLTLISALIDNGVARLAPPVPLAMMVGFFAMNIIGVSTITYLILQYFVREREQAQERSERLLLNILPREIAAILKVESGIIADHFEEASVLFADMVGFTPLSARMAPSETVELLNEIYSHFDSLAEKYGVEKIRTIGDNYMVASGVPTTRADHSQALAKMALDMLDYSRLLPARHGLPLDFRIGIHSGPLVAGVIGQKRFHYDVWGDTVNTASRMESHGLPGKIQVSRTTRDLLGDGFVCEPRGEVDIKGKGQMQTWFLVETA